jgi:hypothetical protein
LDSNSTKGLASFDAGGPIKVAICHSQSSVVSWTIINEEILTIAVDCRDRAIRKFGTGAYLPEVDSVIPSNVDVPNSVLKAIVMMFGRCEVWL